MISAQEFVNVDGSISAIAVAFFSALFGFLTYLSREMFKTRRELRNAKRVADATKRNTDPISGDFARNLETDMRVIIGHQRSIGDAFNQLQDQLQDHLAWHLWNPPRGTNNDSEQQETDHRPYPAGRDSAGRDSAGRDSAERRDHRRDIGLHRREIYLNRTEPRDGTRER